MHVLPIRSNFCAVVLLGTWTPTLLLLRRVSASASSLLSGLDQILTQRQRPNSRVPFFTLILSFFISSFFCEANCHLLYLQTNNTRLPKFIPNTCPHVCPSN
jgi:hypothetical protein